MTTHPHQDPKDGYAIRISKNLPPEAANLSYIHVDKPTPSKNINMKDYTQNIQENKLTLNDELIKAYANNEGLLEVNQEAFKTKNSSVLVTNEFANNIDETPLFYKYKSRLPMNTENIEVSIPLSGNRLSDKDYLYRFDQGKYARFVYEGEKVHISRQEDSGLNDEDVFKITIEREDKNYYLVIYSARELTEGGYEVYYSAIENNRNKNVKEIMNLDKVYKEETQEKDYLSKNNFQLIQNTDNTYSIKLDKEEGNFLITEKERKPYTFDYQLTAEVKTRLGEKNPLNVNIGIIYLNNNIYNALETTGALKKIVYDNPRMPNYITFDNPHRKDEGVHEKTNSRYWQAAHNMPQEHWLDYDILIISGYGEFDISKMNINIKRFLEVGGTFIIETAGEKEEVLELKNNTFSEIKYSKTMIDEGSDNIIAEDLSDRYYDIETTRNIRSVSPTIEYLGTTNERDWSKLVQKNDGKASVIAKAYESGRIIYSNMGILKSILLNNTNALNFYVNFLINLSEQRNFITPVFSDFVYHKDDLYEEEYTDELGRRIYYKDKSDEDVSQVVAKKIIEDNISDVIANYLPGAYKNWQSIVIKNNIFNKKTINVKNSQLSLLGENSIFTKTTEKALPGFNYRSFAGSTGTGTHSVSSSSLIRNYLEVDTTDTHAFFEQNLGLLEPGNYLLEVEVMSEGVSGAGFGLYDVLGEPFDVIQEEGEFGWKNIQLQFRVNEPEELFLRLGQHDREGTIKAKYTDIRLTTKGPVRMLKTSGGEEPLYAYAISPRGKSNELIRFEETYSNPDILKDNINLKTTLVARSYVYRWEHEDIETGKEAGFYKLRGTEKETEISINSKNKEKVLGNILEFIPALPSGIEWSRKQNVFYEFTLDDKRENRNGFGSDDFLNLEIYDPSIDEYFYSASGDWVVNHEDIWHRPLNSTVQLRLKTDYYHLVATNNKFTIGYEDSKKFEVFLPFSEDERDRWNLRIKNGSFTKDVINANELEELRELGKESQYDEYLVGEHLYEMPEYKRQTFYPYFGQRAISEQRALYVNPNKIEVANTPLIINERDIEKERLRPNSTGTIWSSQNIFWDSSKLPTIYVDQLNDGNLTILTRGYNINYTEGKVVFNEKPKGTIYASYLHDNFRIYKRDFKNKSVKNELLKTRDNYSFQLNNKNITIMPAPKIYQGERIKENLVNPSRYWIDYEEGIIHFFDEYSLRVYADYSYFTEKELEYEDVNKNTGEIFLKNRISFKDEIYVSYLTKEDTLEYKGYYDEEIGKFIQLDLNPSSGHHFDYLLEGEVEKLEGYDLLDKEIFVYMLPHQSTYYKTEFTEKHTIRHVFHKEEWDRIKEARPEAILIAQLQVRENTNKENIVMMDSRRQGGGLKDNISEEDIERRVGYTSAFWDIGDFNGLAYYRNGVMVIEIPEKVLKSKGGNFTEDSIEKILNKYIAYGSYPIIEFIKEG